MHVVSHDLGLNLLLYTWTWVLLHNVYQEKLRNRCSISFGLEQDLLFESDG